MLRLNVLLALAAVLAVEVSHGPVAPPAAGDPAAVAIVSTSGKLLPLAAWSGQAWQRLAWPSAELHGAKALQPPALPASVATIPPSWIAPLHAFPSTWRFTPLDGAPRDVHVSVPSAWDTATFKSVGIRVDWSVPGETAGPENYEAGIAVANRAHTLTIHHFHRSTPEWLAFVKAHLAQFAAAEQRDSRGTRRPVTSRPALLQHLLLAEGDLASIALPGGRTYLYFEVVDRRRSTARCTAAGYTGVIETAPHQRERVRAFAPATMTCDDMLETVEIVGALADPGPMRFVVKVAGEDWQEYKIVNPAAPRTWRRY